MKRGVVLACRALAFGALLTGCESALVGASCEEGFTLCRDECVNMRGDFRNCGRCGNTCGDFVCDNGRCSGELRPDVIDAGDRGSELELAATISEAGAPAEDAVPGQVIVIGHDFNDANDAMRRIAGNAVFLARGAAVRVLAYRGRATAASVSGVEAAIDLVKREIGRDWEQTVADENDLQLQLATADVLLIHPQSGATDTALARLGELWRTALAQFISRGGIIVVFEAPSASNDGTYRLLEPARIFGATKRSEIGVQTLRVEAPGLGVASRVPDHYLSASHSLRFEGLTTDGTAIVVDAGGRPVVIQRVIIPQAP